MLDFGLEISMKKFYIVSAIIVLNIFETQLIMTANISGFLLMYLLNENNKETIKGEE